MLHLCPRDPLWLMHQLRNPTRHWITSFPLLKTTVRLSEKRASRHATSTHVRTSITLAPPTRGGSRSEDATEKRNYQFARKRKHGPHRAHKNRRRYSALCLRARLRLCA